MQTACWLAWSIGHQDPRAPAFQRQTTSSPVGRAERRQRLPPRPRRPVAPYRISGRMHSCEDFILAIRRNFMHKEEWGTVQESTRTISASGPATIRVPPGRRRRRTDACRCPTAPCRCRSASTTSTGSRGAGHLHHRVPRRGRPVRPALRRRARLRARRGGHPPAPVTHVLEPVHARAHAGQQDNEFGGGYDVQRGLKAAKYAFCFFDLAPDEALVVECDVPQSRYWSFHLYNLACGEALEYATHVTSRNHTKTRISDDGRIRVVAEDEEPGVPNGSTPRAAGRRSSRSGGSGRRVIRRRRRPRS